VCLRGLGVCEPARFRATGAGTAESLQLPCHSYVTITLHIAFKQVCKTICSGCEGYSLIYI
jgi:hypothetical protein